MFPGGTEVAAETAGSPGSESNDTVCAAGCEGGDIREDLVRNLGRGWGND